MTESETEESSNQLDPALLCQLETPDYQLSLRLANGQVECWADYCRVKNEPAPEPEITAEEEALPAVAENEQELADEQAPGEDSQADVENNAAEDFNPCSTPSLPPVELIGLLHRHNIKAGIDFEALYDFCAGVEIGIEQQVVMLARGIEPTVGADGWFELMVKTSGEDAEFEEDEQGNVDLRTRHAFTEIEVGQKIGILHPPQEGITGMTVHGLPIPAERGRIFSLVAGEGVVMKYDGRAAFAEKEGRAILERQVLAVVDQWVISGDVDYSVGNIDYHGFVEVRGDVLDEFNIKATKGIKVGGVVGACRLESQGPVEIGSMAGKDSGEIICHGDLIAGFLNQATVHCYGDVLVRNEIRNSIVKATGRIIVERGAIMGGSCVALEGIEAKVIGTSAGLETKVTAGIYFPDADRFAFLRESLKRIDDQVVRLKAAIGPLEKLRDLDEVTAKRLSILTEQWEKLEVERDEFRAELAASTKQEQSTNNSKINVGSELLEGAYIHLGDASEKIKIERKGPMTIIENTKEGGLRYLSMSPLQKSANELEKEILATEAKAAREAAAAEAAAVAAAKKESA